MPMHDTTCGDPGDVIAENGRQDRIIVFYLHSWLFLFFLFHSSSVVSRGKSPSQLHLTSSPVTAIIHVPCP